MANQVFAVTVFFICFRECLESSIIVSVLLAFLTQTLGAEGDRASLKRLRIQVWWGVLLGLFLCLCIGAGMIGAFYGLEKDTFTNTEDVWEGVFGLIASIIISIMGAGLLRVNKMREKWRVKLSRALEKKEKSASWVGRLKHWSEKYIMFVLPFVTVLREGLEAIVYIGGVGLGLPASSFPLAIFCGLLAGCAVGYVMYKGGSSAQLQYFLIISTCFLYLVAAGLFSRAVGYFETNTWNHIIGGDASETGSGPGSYDIRQSVWHVNCCNPELNGGGGWGIFNALFGWTNSATYGSVLSYNLYWIVIILSYLAMRFKEQNGYIPVLTRVGKVLKLDRLRKRRDGNGVVMETVEARKEGNDVPVQVVTRTLGEA
ncbi:iron permease FTR1/Fip1/EfeU [Aspergillus similis]